MATIVKMRDKIFEPINEQMPLQAFSNTGALEIVSKHRLLFEEIPPVEPVE